MKKLMLTSLLLACFTFTSYSQEKVQEKQKPKATYQVGAAKVTVWENKKQGKNGEFTVKTFEIEKVYKKDGQWKTTNQFNEVELLKLKEAIDKAISEEAVKVKEVTGSDKKSAE